MKFFRQRWLRRYLSWKGLILCVAPLSLATFMMAAKLMTWNSGRSVVPGAAMRRVYVDSFGNIIQVHGNMIELANDYSHVKHRTRKIRHRGTRNRKRKKPSRRNVEHMYSRTKNPTTHELSTNGAVRGTANLGLWEKNGVVNLSSVFLESKTARTTGYKMCGNGWQESYEVLHESILSSRKLRKFLVYSCKGGGYGCAGYGNRMGGISSLFLLAVLTNRAFIIDWRYSKPLALENFLRPNKIKWNYAVSNLKGLKSRTHYWGKGFPKNLRNESVERPGNVYPEFSNWFRGIDFDNYFEYPVEKITAVWNFAHEIWANQYLARKAREIGLILPTPRLSLVGCSCEFLFKKTPEFEQRLSYARDILDRRPNGPVIGLHIRMGDAVFGRRLKHNTHDYKSFFSCAQVVEQTILRSNPSVKLTDIRWFLATDLADIKDYARSHFLDKVSTLAMVPEHIGIFQKQRYPTFEGMLGVLLDHFLLSECDFLILSNSTFGTSALGLSFHAAGSFTYGERCGLVTRSKLKHSSV